MKILKLLMGDIRFQFKYGFYFVYLVFALMYVILIKVLPGSWTNTMAILLIFSDPSALGLMFMGAIIHLEISEKTINSLYIAPIKPSDYLIAKLLSIALISVLVGLFIGLSVQAITNYFWFILGLLIGSMLFSTLGLILAFKTSTLNQFFISIIPAMILIIIPGAAYCLGLNNPLFIFHPGIAIIELLSAGNYIFLSLVILLIWLTIVFLIAQKVLVKKFKQGSGGRI
ncbi:hypothetical protein KHQ81_07535 [Mycoplasmatota bacterium]|nr:hypothetical protein KHQ81_07535 [Mycoplasmatota bacterium]